MNKSKIKKKESLFEKPLYAEHLNDEGTRVDYVGLSKSAHFSKYENWLVNSNVEIAALDRDGRVAFFINIYNALIIHGQVRRGIPTSLLARLRFFASASYIIG